MGAGLRVVRGRGRTVLVASTRSCFSPIHHPKLVGVSPSCPKYTLDMAQKNPLAKLNWIRRQFFPDLPPSLIVRSRAQVLLLYREADVVALTPCCPLPTSPASPPLSQGHKQVVIHRPFHTAETRRASPCIKSLDSHQPCRNSPPLDTTFPALFSRLLPLSLRRTEPVHIAASPYLPNLPSLHVRNKETHAGQAFTLGRWRCC